MDDERFDRWAKAVATNSSRRGVLRLMAGGTVGALTGLLGREAAACVKGGRACRRGVPCCSGDCRKHKGKRTCAKGVCQGLKPICDDDACEIVVCVIDGSTGASAWVCESSCPAGDACDPGWGCCDGEPCGGLCCHRGSPLSNSCKTNGTDFRCCATDDVYCPLAQRCCPAGTRCDGNSCR